MRFRFLLPWLLPVAVVGLSGCAESLHDTIARGDLKRAKAMLEECPDLVHARNTLGKTPLHYAVNYKQIDAMKLVAQYGADLNAADRTGMTPLHQAAMLGRLDEAHWLLAHGAEVEPRDAFGDTPLHTAAVFGNGRTIPLLLARGASLTAKNARGRTPLDLAHEHRREKATRYIEKLLAQRTK